MYIIEFQKGVYAARWKGDPGRTLKIENAKRFDKAEKAQEQLINILNEIRPFRKFPNARVAWVDEVTQQIDNKEIKSIGL